MKKSIKHLLFSLIVIVIMIISFLVTINYEFIIDGKVYDLFVSFRTDNLNAIFKFITMLGGISFISFILIISIIVVPKQEYRLLILINVIFITLFNLFLKGVFARQRPDELRLIDIGGYSFPSGHAMVATAFYGLLILLLYNLCHNSIKKYIIIGVLSILIIFIAISRVYLGVHYLSDVIVGILISLVYLTLLELFIRKKQQKAKK